MTEDLVGFLALVAIEMGWASEASAPTAPGDGGGGGGAARADGALAQLCALPQALDAHRNARRPTRAAFAADAVAFVEAALAPELAVYAHAAELYAAHAARRGRAFCLLYTSPSPRDRTRSRMPSSA